MIHVRVPWLLIPLTLLSAASSGGARAAEELQVVWIDAEGAEIPRGRGALGVHGLADDGMDADASPARFRLVIDAHPGPPLLRLTLASVPASGRRDRDALRDVPLVPLADGRLATPWLVAVSHWKDRRHPDLEQRSLLVRVDDLVEARIRRGGGRALRSRRAVTRLEGGEGPAARRRVVLDTVVFRDPGGRPLVGGDDAGALAAMQFQVEVLSELLAPCAVWAGPPEELRVRILAAAPSALIAIGDPLGLPSAGGEVRLEVDGVRLPAIRVGEGNLPEETARLLATHVRKAGFEAGVSTNAPNPFAAGATADVVVSRADGSPAVVRSWEGSPVTTDERQPVRIGALEPDLGLETFGPNDLASGTVMERALVKVFGPGRPGTIRVFVAGALASGRRQGEAFTRSSHTDMADVVILDRRSFWRTRQAYALPHEIVHVLLGDPGHPDAAGDFRPELLMHSCASSAIDGPRRLTAKQCSIIRHRLAEWVSSSSGTETTCRIRPSRLQEGGTSSRGSCASRSRASRRHAPCRC